VQIRSLLETETDTERREKLLAVRFRDTERESAGVGLRLLEYHPGPNKETVKV
jgi:hypothetical protein